MAQEDCQLARSKLVGPGKEEESGRYTDRTEDRRVEAGCILGVRIREPWYRFGLGLGESIVVAIAEIQIQRETLPSSLVFDLE
jgi:hypothetical protein